MQIEYKRLEDIIPYAANPRKNDDAVEYVARSISEFGFKVPIIIDKDGVIIAGHTRYKAAKYLGMNEVPVICADDLTEEQVKAFRLADNKVAEMAEWDPDLLDLELDELKLDFDMSLFGFDLSVESNTGTSIEVEIPEVPDVPESQIGDIYQLGNHRLMCGDSTNPDDVANLMNGIKADLVFTDPPYGMKKEGVTNDNLNDNDLLEFNKKWIPLSFDNLKENGSWYCWGMDEPLMDIYSIILKPMINKNKITFRNLLTWDKGDAGAGGVSFMGKDGLRSYPISDEKCLFVMCGVQGFNNNKDNYFEDYEPIRSYLETEAKKIGLDEKKVKEICGVGMYSHWFTKSQWAFLKEEYYKKIQDYCIENNLNAFGVEFGEIKKQYDEIKKQYDEIKKEWYESRSYFDNTHDNMKTVWNYTRVRGKEREGTGGHTTPKPIALCSRAIKSSSRENEVVLDLFGGSGSTLIACEQENRKCYMMEYEPKWVDVIIQRWENFTGKKAIKLNNENINNNIDNNLFNIEEFDDSDDIF